MEQVEHRYNQLGERMDMNEEEEKEKNECGL